jgi:hypothetical protein
VIFEKFPFKNVFIETLHTASTQYWKFETNIPRKGIARPQSQFPHSCVCERFIYAHNWSTYYAAGKYGQILGIYKTLTDTWMWILGLRPCNSISGYTYMGFSLKCIAQWTFTLWSAGVWQMKHLPEGRYSSQLRIRDVFPDSESQFRLFYIPNPNFSIPDPNPGSASKNLSILTPKNGNMIRLVHSGSRIRILTFYPSRILSLHSYTIWRIEKYWFVTDLFDNWFEN